MTNNENKNGRVHELKILNRDHGFLSGIEKVVSSCETYLVLVSSCGNLRIDGEKLKINKYDVESGTLDFEGKVNSVKYSGEQKSLLKRIFK